MWKIIAWLYHTLGVDRVSMQRWMMRKYGIKPGMTNVYYHGLIAEKGILGRLLFKAGMR
jgi:hypothetical protein